MTNRTVYLLPENSEAIWINPNNSKYYAVLLGLTKRTLEVENSRDGFRTTNCNSCQYHTTPSTVLKSLSSLGITSPNQADLTDYLQRNALCISTDNNISSDFSCLNGLLYTKTVKIKDVELPECLAVVGYKGDKSGFYIGATLDTTNNTQSSPLLHKLTIGNMADDCSLCLSDNPKDLTGMTLPQAVERYFGTPFNNSLSAPGTRVDEIIRSGNFIDPSKAVELNKLLGLKDGQPSICYRISEPIIKGQSFFVALLLSTDPQDLILAGDDFVIDGTLVGEIYKSSDKGCLMQVTSVDGTRTKLFSRTSLNPNSSLTLMLEAY